MTGSIDMPWYLAVLQYETETERPSQRLERSILIRADEDDWAWEKAFLLGKLQKHILFSNPQKINFVNVKKIFSLDHQQEGMILLAENGELVSSNANEPLG